MRNKKRLITLFFILTLLLVGCSKNSSTKEDKSTNSTKNNTSNSVTSDEGIVSTIINEADMFSDRDFETNYDVDKCVAVKLNGDSASCDSDAVKIKDTTITLSEEGTYIFSGTLDNGMIIVRAEDTDKLHLILDNASITNNTSASLYIIEADKVFVTLADGSANTLSNGGTFEAIDDNNIDGAVFSKQDLTFNGAGSLTVSSPADHGIVCKDDLVFTGGTYTVNSASHGLDANDSVRITQASITVTSGKDGIHAENSDDTTLGFMYIKDGDFKIYAEGDGLSAGNSMQINDGTFTIASGDDAFHADESLSISGGNINVSESYEGLEALDIKVSGGDIKLVASDDGINAAGGTDGSGYGGTRGNEQFGPGRGMGGPGGGMGGPGGSSSSNGSIIISGGTLHINASGDGIDANGYLEITDGHTVVVGPTQGDTATLDYDTSATITGGTFIGTGASGMAQTFSDSKQGVIALSVGSQSAGTLIEVKDTKGNVLISHEPELSYAVVILSSPDMKKGETYTVNIGSLSDEFEAK